jgi:membrane protease YdiL (CAAX protease family)
MSLEQSPEIPARSAAAEDRVTRIESRFNAASAIVPFSGYLHLSKTLTYSFLFVLPLLIIYEGGTWLLNLGRTGEVRLGADLWIRDFLSLLGLGGTFWVAALVVLVGGVILFVERRKGIRLRIGYFALMLAESSVYAVVVGLLVSSLVSGLVGAAPALQIAGTSNVASGLVLSLGAGVYEELIFRLVLVTALAALLGFLPIGRTARYVVAAIVGALIFSWVHYVGSLAYPFTLESFLFRAFMGLALNGLFLLRGFGIAAMTHSLYDVLVTLMG